MIDVFFCSITGSDFLREAMADLCLRRWMQIKGVRLFQINEDILECSPLEFQRQRRIYADQNAESSIYVVADDDCWIPAEFSMDGCLKAMNGHREFASISLIHSNCHIADWRPEGYIPERTPSVMEHYAAGGIRFCRKDYLKGWPPMGDGPGYDTIHGEAIRKAGFRVGYFTFRTDFHLGEGLEFSQVWRKPQAVTA